MPRATVIIAAYNWSSVLPFSIGRALRQTIEDIEVLVIGDCCTDDSEDVVEAIQDSRVKWINLPQRYGHQSGPNNEGLRRASAPVVFYLGHDDLWFPHHVACLLKEIEAGVDISHGLIVRVAPDGRLTMVPRPGPLGAHSVVPPSAVAHRLSLANRWGGWCDYRESSLMPELELLERYRSAGAVVGSVNRITTVKISAALRPGVYLTRPCHEQEAWSHRIQTEADMEATLMGELMAQYVVKYGPRPLKGEVTRFLSTIASRVKKKYSRQRSPKERIQKSQARKGSA